MSSGDNSRQTQQTTSEPWSAAQGALKLGLKDAQDLYKDGAGSKIYKDSTVVPYASQTKVGMQNLQNAATGSLPTLKDQFNRVAAQAKNGGLNALQQGAVSKLQAQANGSMLNGNPFLDKMIASNSKDINDAIALSASGSGRYGSGVHQGVLAEAVGDMANEARYQNYANERQFQQDAIGSIFNAGQQAQSNVIGNTQALGNAYQGLLQPANTLLTLGGMNEERDAQKLNDKLRIFNAKNNGPWEAIARLNGVASGAGSMGSTNTTYAQAPSRLQTIGSGAISGLSMAGGNPWGALLGAGVGAFG